MPGIQAAPRAKAAPWAAGLAIPQEPVPACCLQGVTADTPVSQPVPPAGTSGVLWVRPGLGNAQGSAEDEPPLLHSPQGSAEPWAGTRLRGGDCDPAQVPS